MHKVKINKDGFMESPYILDATIEVEVDDDQYEKLQSFPFYHNWKYKDGKWDCVVIDEDNWLRFRRQRDCFDLIDGKSNMWYQMLTPEQNDELKKWYQAWLDVTDTKVMPTKPEWLK